MYIASFSTHTYTRNAASVIYTPQINRWGNEIKFFSYNLQMSSKHITSRQPFWKLKGSTLLRFFCCCPEPVGWEGQLSLDPLTQTTGEGKLLVSKSKRERGGKNKIKCPAILCEAIWVSDHQRTINLQKFLPFLSIIICFIY